MVGHLMIAGTGRSGTSFLVRYLTGLGLDTEMSRSGSHSWNDDANAGFEDAPALIRPGEAPQVIKSPWLHEYIDELLAKGEIRLDAVIVPIRDLTEAATSRSVLELRAMHEQAPWMAALDRSYETWCTTQGGAIYSVNPLDQARILAVGFHRLIERLVRADIPIVFLDFPRLVTDGAYLLAKLRPLLHGVDDATALALHARITDPGKVRITNSGALPSHEQLEAAAVRRELARTRAELDRLQASLWWRLDRLLRRLIGPRRR